MGKSAALKRDYVTVPGSTVGVGDAALRFLPDDATMKADWVPFATLSAECEAEAKTVGWKGELVVVRWRAKQAGWV